MAAPAYRFDLFETSPRKEQEQVRPEQEVKVTPELKVAVTSPAKSGKPIIIGIIFALVFAVFFMYIYSMGKMNEVNERINAANAQLEEAQAINQTLQTQLAGSVSLDNVEKYAEQELGMQKINPSQEKYVEMQFGSMSECAEDDSGDIFVTIRNWFDSVLVYLGF